MSSSQPGMSLQLADNSSLNVQEASTKIPRLEISSRGSSRHGSISDRDGPDTPGRGQRPRRDSAGRSSLPKSPVSKVSSSIPLPVKAPGSRTVQKVPSMCASVMSGRTLRSSTSTIKGGGASNLAANRHSLEMQFMNKKKRLSLLKKELTDKQRPVVDLYQNLMQIKKKLEELGKVVYLEEIKVLTYDEKADSIEPGGDCRDPEFAAEMLAGMKTTTEDIPKTLMDICQNLLCRRNVIVELLDGVVRSEVGVETLNEQVEALKAEGVQLQNNLDAVIVEHHRQIKEIVQNWSRMLQNKSNVYTNAKVDELQEKLRVQEKMTEDAKATIVELQRKLEDRRSTHDRCMSDLNAVVATLKDQVQKLEQEVEIEKKAVAEFKTRNHANAQTTKNLRARITELEASKRTVETTNQENARKIKLMQEQVKNKEAQWLKEKDELLKNLKHQENLLQKANTDKQSFETRLEEVREENKGIESELQSKIESLMDEIEETRASVRKAQEEKEEIKRKYDTLEEFIKSGGDTRTKIGTITNRIEWGTSTNTVFGTTEKPKKLNFEGLQTQPTLDGKPDGSLSSDTFGACRKQLAELESEKLAMQISLKEETSEAVKEAVERQRAATEAEQTELIKNYQKAMVEWRDRYITNSSEVAALKNDIRCLRARLDDLRKPGTWKTEEELNVLLEDYKKKLDGLAFRTLQREEAIAQCESIQERLNKQINELENFVRQRENVAGVLKASRDELMLEKESLSKYSHEMRNTLNELTKENKWKDKLIKQYQHKLCQQDRLLHQVESEIRDMESKASVSNTSRLLCQEDVEVEPPPVDSRYDVPGTMRRHHNFAAEPPQAPPQRCGLSDDMRKSLMGASLKQMDLMKARLMYLTKINLATVASRESLRFGGLKVPKAEMCRSSSVPSIQKALDLSVKRYSLLQKQAYESYEDITNLFKLAISAQALNHK